MALGWGLPIAVPVAAAPLAGLAKTLLWLAALAWMALACLGNALRRRRLRCYFSGPFFLVMARARHHGRGRRPRPVAAAGAGLGSLRRKG